MLPTQPDVALHPPSSSSPSTTPSPSSITLPHPTAPASTPDIVITAPPRPDRAPETTSASSSTTQAQAHSAVDPAPPLQVHTAGAASTTAPDASTPARALFHALHVEEPPPRYDGDMSGAPMMRSISDLKQKILSVLPTLDPTRRGSRGYAYSPVGLLSPPESRRGSSNTDDLEAGTASSDAAQPSLMSFFTSKRRQARQGRWAAVVLVAGGLMYLVISNLLVSDWIDAHAPHLDLNEVVEWSQDWLGGAVSLGLPVAPSWMGRGVVLVPEDQSHVLVPVLDDLPVELLTPIKRFHAPSLVDFYTTGRLSDLPSSDMPYPTADMLYTFVNASSPVLQDAMARKRIDEGLPPVVANQNRWRDNGELRGALRSGVQSLGKAVRTVHVISADFDLPPEVTEAEVEDEKDATTGAREGEEGYEWVETETERDDKEALGRWKIGQVPTWIDTMAEQDKLAWHFHSEIYRLPMDKGAMDPRVEKSWATEEEWKGIASPTFSSFSIESRLGWTRGLDENIIYSNDDMFLLNKLELSDYHHPLLGPIIRVTSELGLRVKGNLTPDLYSSGGEWGGLQHASLLLKNRFVPRARNYMLHMPKALTKSMMHEASVMFAHELSLSATRAFRISHRGLADIHFPWLVSQLRIERWREALLWSWAVARMGGEDGLWTLEAREELAELFGMEKPEDADREVTFRQRPRETIRDMEGIMEKHGWEFPLASNYAWTSLDGLMPQEAGNWDIARSCKIIPTECFPHAAFNASYGAVDAAVTFVNLAFGSPHCGDCLIMGLIAKSGPRGLDALLPRAEQTYRPTTSTNRTPEMWERSEPMLPLVPRWQDAMFNLEWIVRPDQDLWEGSAPPREEGVVNLRDWCVKLLSRYVYSLADSPTHFGMARSPSELARTFKHLDEHPEIAMTCINDDQNGDSAEEAARAFGQWMETRWGALDAPWEREGVEWFEPEQEGEKEAE